MIRFIAVLITLVSLGGFAADRPGELSKKEVKELIAHAASSTDHKRLSQHFRARAEKYEAESAEHIQMAQMYRAHPTVSEIKRPMSPDTAAHCDYIARSLAKAATEARALSAIHGQMAKH